VALPSRRQGFGRLNRHSLADSAADQGNGRSGAVRAASDWPQITAWKIAV